MAKSRNNDSFWAELIKFTLYKRNQGRLTRQLSWVGFAMIVFFGAWTLSQGPLLEFQPAIRVGIPLVLCLAGGWALFRLVNYPRFADFLISVEAEIDKVSWASADELKRATAVVLSTMLFLGVVLFAYDWLWVKIFTLLRILQLSDS